MNEIESLVKNFLSIARERVYLAIAFSTILVVLGVIAANILIGLCVLIVFHSVEMFIVNKSFQSHFADLPKFSKALEILDGISLGLFLVYFIIIFTCAVFL